MLKIRELRKSMNLTQEEAATQSGVSLRSWGAYENGSREPRADVLPKIAKFFKVTIDELYEEEYRTPVAELFGEEDPQGETPTAGIADDETVANIYLKIIQDMAAGMADGDVELAETVMLLTKKLNEMQDKASLAGRVVDEDDEILGLYETLATA